MKRSPMPKRSKPMKRSGALSRRLPIRGGDRTGRRRSTGRRERRPAGGFPAAVRLAAFERDGGCMARGVWPDVRCGGRLHCHHVILQGQGGPDTLDNALTLCEVHHRHAHDVDRAGAEQAGIIRRRATGVE